MYTVALSTHICGRQRRCWGDGPCTAWISAALTHPGLIPVCGISSIFPSLADALELDVHFGSGVSVAAWPGKAFHVGCLVIRRQRLCKWRKKRSFAYTSWAEDVVRRGALLPRTPPTSAGCRRGWGSGGATSVSFRENELSVIGHCRSGGPHGSLCERSLWCWRQQAGRTHPSPPIAGDKGSRLCAVNI